MLFKLSLKNIRKSIKDYSIYFFTLVFAVAMFYSFNSLDAQSSMIQLTQAKSETIKDLVFLINYISVFVSVILGFLIVYSNNYLIRRRKKEIGLYFTLGMSKRKVSFILVIETLIIGIISLGVGLLCGVLISQFLSIFVAKLFEADLTAYHFVFSSMAFEKTLLYFGIIFLFVICLSVVSLSRYKLIDLINADRKNERVKVRNKYVTIITFLLSMGTLGYAYYLLFNNALLSGTNDTIKMILFGSVGTYLLFFSLSGFLLKVIARRKKLYYNNLNIFTLNQINNRINTTVISTSVICLMLLLTIGSLSGSLSLAGALNSDLTENNLTDFTINSERMEYTFEEGVNEPIVKENDYKGMNEYLNSGKLTEFSKKYYSYYKYVDDNFITTNLMTQKSIQELVDEYGEQLDLDFSVPFLKESDYVNIMKLYGMESIDIDDDEYLLLANLDLVLDAYDDHYEEGLKITVNGKNLKPGSKEIIEVALENTVGNGNDGVVVVSDELVEGLSPSNFITIGYFVDNDNEELIGNNLLNSVRSASQDWEVGTSFRVSTKFEIESMSVGNKVMMTFIGIYVGITFAISSATVLAIGQLSESSDNKKRYRIIRQLGADNKMINKALFTQIAVIFLFPLGVAMIHAYFGLKEVNKLIISIGNIDLTSNILITAIFMIVVYGGYFLFTYLCSKNIIKE